MAEDEREDLDIITLEEQLSDAEKPPELPAGLYEGELQDGQMASPQKGNKYFAIKFVIPQEQVPVDMQDQFEDGCALYWNRQVVPSTKDRRALFNLKKFVEAIGLDSETTTINPSDWMGQTARLRVRRRGFQGEMRAEIQAVEAMEGAAPAWQGEPEEEEAAPKRRRGGARRSVKGDLDI